MPFKRERRMAVRDITYLFVRWVWGDKGSHPSCWCHYLSLRTTERRKAQTGRWDVTMDDKIGRNRKESFQTQRFVRRGGKRYGWLGREDGGNQDSSNESIIAEHFQCTYAEINCKYWSTRLKVSESHLIKWLIACAVELEKKRKRMREIEQRERECKRERERGRETREGLRWRNNNRRRKLVDVLWRACKASHEDETIQLWHYYLSAALSCIWDEIPLGVCIARSI